MVQGCHKFPTTLRPCLYFQYYDEKGCSVHVHAPPGGNILMGIEPFPIKNYLPRDDDIEWEVHRLFRQRSVRPSKIREEHLQGWIEAATQKRDLETDSWEQIIDLFETAFRDGTDRTRNLRVTRKTDNHLKGIPNLVRNGNRNHWPRRLSMPT